jgi:Na+/H+ antiporter NhaD/arsenite permease-like protein
VWRVPVLAAFVLLACLAFAAVVWHRRAGRENTAELDEAIGRVREGVRELRWRRAVIPGAVVVALVLLATLARNPSRWALLLAALAALAGAVIAFVVAERGRRAD